MKICFLSKKSAKDVGLLAGVSIDWSVMWNGYYNIDRYDWMEYALYQIGISNLGFHNHI